MTRLVLPSLRAIGLAAVAVCAASALLPPAVAATKAAKPAPKSGAKEEASKPSLVATFGDWNVFVGEVGKGRICYSLAQPKSREPAGLTRDPGYAFISDRPSEGVRNEVSFIMGFDVSGGDTAESEFRGQAGESVEVERQIEDVRRRRGPGRPGRPGVVRDASQGGKPLGQERGERERADRRNAQRREIGGQGGVAQRPPINRHLCAWRVLAGDGPAAERMPGEVGFAAPNLGIESV